MRRKSCGGRPEEQDMAEDGRCGDGGSSCQTLGWTAAWREIFLLVLLYCLQGVPLGLVFGSLPFLLERRVSFADLGLFALAAWPYSLKLMWSPFVDTHFSTRVGRRQSWIVPSQLATAALMVYISRWVDGALEAPEVPVVAISTSFFALVVLAATQDIAVDGWALTLLPDGLKSLASPCQTVGLNVGFFLSFTVFLALNSVEFSNRYVFSSPQELPLLSLGQYMCFWALMYFAVTVYLVVTRRPEPAADGYESLSLGRVYVLIARLFCKRPVQMLAAALMIARIGSAGAEVLAAFVLLDSGFRKEYLALFSLIDFPFQILFAVVAGSLQRRLHPLRLYLVSYVLRLLVSMAIIANVLAFPVLAPGEDVSWFFFVTVLGMMLLRSFNSTVMFVAQGAFFAQISDDSIGGTYMTLLNTMANLGGSWPQPLIFFVINYIVVRGCVVPGGDAPTSSEALDASCRASKNSAECASAGGRCLDMEGSFAIVSVSLVVLGVAMLPVLYRLVRGCQRARPADWKIATSCTP